MAEEVLDEVLADGPGQPGAGLADEHRAKLDSIVQQMIRNRESDSDIQTVVNDFKQKYSIKQPVVSQAKQEQPAFQLSDPTFKAIPNESAVKPSAPNEKINISQGEINYVPDEKTFEIQKQQGKAKVAHEKVNAALVGNDSQYEKKLRESRRDNYTVESLRNEYKQNGQILSPQDEPKLLQKEKERRYNLPVTKEELSDFKTGTILTPKLSRKFIKDLNDKDVAESAYQVDKFNELANDSDPNAHKRIEKINEVAKGIKKGTYVYDPETKAVVQPMGMIGSIMEGVKNKFKADEEHDFLKNTTNDAAIIMELEGERNNPDLDQPIKVPRGKINEALNSLAEMPIMPMIAGAVGTVGGTFIGNPELGTVAATALGAYENRKAQYRSAFKQVYNEMRDQGKPEFDALNEARKQAENAQEIGTIVGAAQGYLGAKIGEIPIKGTTFSLGYQKAVGQFLKNNGSELGKIALDAGAQGGLGAAGEIAKNKLAQAAGIKRDWDAGAADAFYGNAIMAGGIGAALKLGRGLSKINYKTILDGLTKSVPEEAINSTLQEKVATGEITQDAANQALNEIKEYKEKDAQIPANVTEEARFKIQDNIDKINELEQQKEQTHKSLQGPIKEKIDKLVEDNLSLSKETVKQEKPVSGLSKDKEKEAIDFAHELVDEGILPDTYAAEAKKDPIKFWQTIAQQAQNRDENWKPLSQPLDEQAVKDNYGDTVVDYAKELFPAPEVHEPSNLISVIQPGEIKQPETITIAPREQPNDVQSTENVSVIMPRGRESETVTIKPENNAIQESSAVNLQETQHGELQTNKNILSKGAQTKSAVRGETTANYSEEATNRRIKAADAWLEAIERNDSKKKQDIEREMFGKSLSEGGVLADFNHRGEEIRTSSGHGDEAGAKVEAERARTSQGSQRTEQSSGQFGTTESKRAQQVTPKRENSGAKGEIRGISEAERRAVVAEVQKLSGLRNERETTQSIRTLRKMLRENASSKKKTNEIIDLITQTLEDNGTLQKSISGGIFQHPQEGTGTEGGERIGVESSQQGEVPAGAHTEEEGNATSQEGIGEPPASVPAEKGVYAEHPETQLSFRGLQDTANEFGFEDVKSRDRVSDLQERKNAEMEVNEWVSRGEYQQNIDHLLTEIENRRLVPVARQRLILEQYLANEKQKARELPKNSAEYDAQILKLQRIKDIGQIARQEAGAALRLPDAGTLPHPIGDESDAMVAKMKANNVDKLTDQQKAEVEAQVEKYKERDEKAKLRIAELEELAAKMDAQKELNKVKSTTKRVKKTAEERATYRRSEIEAAREALSKLKRGGGPLYAVPVPGFAQLMAIAPHVKNLMVDLVSQGVDNLQDVISHLHGEFKDVLDGLTEKNIHDIIAGEYNEAGRPLSELQRQVRDLQDEAKLINQIEALENGVEPKTEKAKRERNQKIKALRDKIKELKATDGADELLAIKKRNEELTKKIKEKIAKGVFEKEAKKSIFDREDVKKNYPKLRKEALDAIVQKEEAQHEFDLALFNDEMKKRDWWQKTTSFSGKLIHTSKALLSGIDDSATFVQNGMAMLANPKMGAKVWAKHWKEAFNEASFRRELTALHQRPDWEVIQKSGLDVIEPHSAASKQVEEAFEQNLLAGKIKIREKEYQPWKYTGGIFERAFTSMGNNFRVALFEKRMKMLLDEGKTFESHPKEYKAAAQAINDLTGRAKLPNSIAQASPWLTTVIWAPRLLASTLNTLGLSDVAFTLMGKGENGFYRSLTPTQRKFALGQLGRGIGMGVAVMGAASLAGAKVDYDPRSVTFGDIIIGDHHVNVFGRYTPVIKTIVQFAFGVRLKNGVPQDLDSGKFGAKTRAGVIGGFFRGKMTPAAGAAYDLAVGKNYYTGEKFTVKDLPTALLQPMSIKELRDGWANDGTATILNRFLPAFEGLKTSDERDFNKKGGSGGGAGATGSLGHKTTTHKKNHISHKTNR
jgi:hypothetical protein